MRHDADVHTVTLRRKQRRLKAEGKGTAEDRFPPGTLSPWGDQGGGKLLAGRYRVTHALGRGGMGEVYRADDTKLGVPVALKLLPAALERHEEHLALFLNEARLARAVTHENVCRIHDVGESEGLHFISMELVTGEDLASLLRRIGRLPRDKALDVARGICAGLDAAHAQGILHRDLKPANLMIDDTGEVRITDFGISLHLDDAPAEISAGTPAYMAPEQAAGGEISVRTDLYALGLVLFEIFTGRSAFQASTAGDLERLHRETAPPPPSSLVPELDPAIENIILRCLEKDPRARPVSARAVGAALPGRVEPLSGTVLGTLVAGELVAALDAAAVERHERRVRDLVREHGGRELRWAGEYWLFERPIHAVLFACAYHEALSPARLGIHLGEIALRRGATLEHADTEPTATRLMALAVPGQTLIDRAAFDVARSSAVAEPTLARRLGWQAHGRYVFAAGGEAVEVFEVGDRERAPLRAPEDSEVASRVLGEDLVLGWRPAPGLPLPGRDRFTIDKKLGAGGFGEVWLAVHEKTRERRVFKFCYEASRLRALQREITLFRLLKEELGERDDIARVLDWNFDEAPYFIESEYTAGGDLNEWAAGRGGIGAVALGERLEIVAQVADALAAAHSVGVLHKDVKPANVLIRRDAEGRVRTRLTDFGIGAVTDPGRLAEAGITALGLSASRSDESSTSGTWLYMAPELIEGKAATVQADVYALGVMLYQVLLGDLGRALAPGWQREIKEGEIAGELSRELLCEDVAAAVDGDAGHRLADAAELARRLRRLDERRAERRAEERLRDTLERFRRRRRQALFAAAVLAVVTAVVAVAAFLVRGEAQRARDLARAAVAGNLLAEGRTTLGNLVALEVRHPGSTETAAALLDKALRQPVYLASVEDNDAAFLSDSWSPDSSRLLAISAGGGALRICDAATGGEIRHWRQSETILDASWSPDGTRVLTVSERAVRVWDVASGALLFILDAAAAPFHGALWNGDDSRLLTLSGNEAAVWDVMARQGADRLVVRLVGHTDRILDASWRIPSEGGGRILTSSADRTARLWDAVSGAEIRRFEDPMDRVDRVAWSGDGTRVLTVSAARTARVWDAESGVETTRFEGHETGIHSASWNGDGLVLTASWDTARVWDGDTGEEIVRLLGHSDVIHSAAWSHDGRRILTASADRTARIWDARSGRETARMQGHADTASAATWSGDDRLVLAVSWEVAARVWNTRVGEEAARLIGHSGMVLSVAWSADGSRVLTASGDGTARVWDARTGRQSIVFAGHHDVVSAALWSHDGGRVLTASDDGTARIWDAESGRQTVVFAGHTDILLSAVWSGDGGRVLTASADGTVRVWEAGSGEERLILDSRSDTLASASWSADGTRVLATLLDGTFLAWDASTGEETSHLPDPGTPVPTFSNAAERIRGARSGAELAWLAGHRQIGALASWSGDGRRLVTASDDRTARVWVMDDADASYVRGRVRARTRICLDAELRQTALGEPEAEARRANAVCERCVPVFFERLGEEPAPWESYAEAWQAYASCLGRSGS